MNAERDAGGKSMFTYCQQHCSESIVSVKQQPIFNPNKRADTKHKIASISVKHIFQRRNRRHLNSHQKLFISRVKVREVYKSWVSELFMSKGHTRYRRFVRVPHMDK